MEKILFLYTNIIKSKISGKWLNIFTLGDVVFGVGFGNAFLCIEGETSELRFVFLETFVLEDALFPSTPQTFVTKETNKNITILSTFRNLLGNKNIHSDNILTNQEHFLGFPSSYKYLLLRQPLLHRWRSFWNLCVSSPMASWCDILQQLYVINLLHHYSLSNNHLPFYDSVNLKQKQTIFNNIKMSVWNKNKENSCLQNHKYHLL